MKERGRPPNAKSSVFLKKSNSDIWSGILDTLKGLGLCEITLGLLSLYYIGYGLAFWVLGFGVLHIAYGLYMHIKYD